jgi:hypothetical protein
MTVVELLRALLDLIDKKDSTTDRLTPVEIDNKDGVEQAAQDGDSDAQNNADGQSTMIFPLQQKIELLKKSVDVPSEFDQEDELDIIKKRAGISSCGCQSKPNIHELSQDNDILG